jgi:predicted nucleic acid-binding protein
LTIYLDTSLLVAALTPEQRTVDVLEWLNRQDPDELSISDWVICEFSSALSTKMRTRQISAAQRAGALAAFAQLSANTLAVLPVSRAQFRTAARFADQHALGLRSPDALHLAICAAHGATLCTLDQPLSQAAAALGVTTQLI